MSRLVRLVLTTILVIGLTFFAPREAKAGEVLGIHILHPSEINDVTTLLKTEANKDQWSYVTIPYGLADVEKNTEWQAFFDICRDKKLIPIVRLVTKAEGPTWVVPTKKNIVDLSNGLSKLNWPTDERLVIMFNEPNHAKEWGGTINPEEYATVLRFGAEWFKTEGKNYKVLPAGLDLAAPNGSQTMEAFTYWKRALAVDPDLFQVIDDWNSHSYPNPGFSSSPTRTTQNSLKGFIHELEFVKEHSDRDLGVYITETGWAENAATRRHLTNYYAYAQQHIWSDPRVKAVTPFLLRGAPGPFAEFSFFDQAGNKTVQFDAYRKIIETL